jgi:hypothetical protein
MPVCREKKYRYRYLVLVNFFFFRYKVEEAPKKSGTLLEGGVDDDASAKAIRYKNRYTFI